MYNNLRAVLDKILKILSYFSLSFCTSDVFHFRTATNLLIWLILKMHTEKGIFMARNKQFPSRRTGSSMLNIIVFLAKETLFNSELNRVFHENKHSLQHLKIFFPCWRALSARLLSISCMTMSTLPCLRSRSIILKTLYMLN